jgi:hypothetical protein
MSFLALKNQRRAGSAIATGRNLCRVGHPVSAVVEGLR